MLPSEVRNQRVLISCLNWGKGHVARSIGLIQQLLDQDNQVYIAADLDQQLIFQSYFPQVNFLEIQPYPFYFSGNGNFAVDLWRSRKNILRTIQNEEKQVKHWVNEFKINLVISDHRYGFRSNAIPSIFVTHQLNLPISWWQKPAQWWHSAQLKLFNEIWVMDSSDSLLAGKLSKNSGFKNVEYIGYYSRFVFHKISSERTKELDLVVCSGPSPYDEQLLLLYLEDENKRIICSPKLATKYNTPNLVPACNWLEIDELMMNAHTIHSYSGYSTLMDLQFLKCKSMLRATVGQTEQEYLLQLHSNNINK